MTKAKKRPPKKSDQKNTEKAYQILLEAMQNHPEVEPTLWAGACWTALVSGYLNCGISYKEFCEDFEEAKEHYRLRWEDGRACKFVREKTKTSDDKAKG